jgi:hypothetical protein
MSDTHTAAEWIDILTARIATLEAALARIEGRSRHWAAVFANSEATEARWMEIARWARHVLPAPPHTGSEGGA